MLWVLGCSSACSGCRDICQSMSNNEDSGSEILIIMTLHACGSISRKFCEFSVGYWLAHIW